MDASMIHPQKQIPIDFHLRKKHAKKKYPERFFSHQRETFVGERGRSESLEKNGFPPLAALCETDRYLVPLIGWINGPGCGVTGVQVARREMDGTREKKRRFSTWGKDHGRWIRGGGWRGPRMLRPFRLTMRLISRTVSVWLDISTSIYRVFCKKPVII